MSQFACKKSCTYYFTSLGGGEGGGEDFIFKNVNIDA